MWLDSELQKGRLAYVKTQVPIQLRTNGKLIGRYVTDFEVGYPDGHKEWHEVKGKWEPLARWKVAHCRAQYPTTRLVVIRSAAGWS